MSIMRPICEKFQRATVNLGDSHSERFEILPKPVYDDPKPDKKPGKRLLQAFAFGFALWGLIDIGMRGLPVVISMFGSKVNHDCWCGETDKQAMAMGCQYDHLAVDWLPASCIDQDLVEEFDVSGPGADGAWPYYTRAQGNNGGTSFIPIKSNETDEFAQQGRDYYATREWHISHCMFTWRKQFRARQNGKHIEPWNENEDHIKHCNDYIMRTLKRNLSLDVVDALILGTNRHRSESEE